MTRKQKGPTVLTSKGVFQDDLPRNKKEREEVIAKNFCKTYSNKHKNTLKIKLKTEAPDFICIKDDNKIALEICELVYDNQLIIDTNYDNLEGYFKKSLKIPKDIFLEIINFNIEPKNIPNPKNKKGIKGLNIFLKEVKNNLLFASKIEKGKWEYYIWKHNRCHFEYRISKLPVKRFLPIKDNFNLHLEGINTIESTTHKDLLINLVKNKMAIKYINAPKGSFLWLLIYSYRYFPLDFQDESVQKLTNKLKDDKPIFDEIWYFWPTPIGDGMIFQIYRQQ